MARGKIYSLCSSHDLGPTAGYMQYRAGRVGATEFSFPAKREHPKGRFHFDLLPHGAALNFSNGEYRYVVHEPLRGRTSIDVESNHVPVATVTCEAATDTLTLTTTLERFERSGVDK